MDAASAQAEMLSRLALEPVRRTDGLGLRWQAAGTLRRLITDLHYPPAVPLPPEKDLASVLGISRPTLRQAMSTLANEGLIHSQRGVGAFVVGSTLVRPATSVGSLYNYLQGQGSEPTTRVLAMRHLAADAATARGMKLPEGTPLQYVERVRYAAKRPLVLMRNQLWLPDGLELTRGQLETDGLYNILHRIAGIELVGGNQTVTARIIRNDEAEYLELPRGSAALVAQRYTFDTQGRGIESCNIVYPEGTELYTADLRGTSLR